MRIIVAIILVLLVDLTSYALCKANKKETKLKNPERIKIRGKNY